MAILYRSIKPISAVELFDGRLAAFGIYEHAAHETSESVKCLTDGCNSFLWVYCSERGEVNLFVAHPSIGESSGILASIEKPFDTDIVSEHEPQFWGFESHKEWFEARGWPLDLDIDTSSD
jgi:hypothetical protein